MKTIKINISQLGNACPSQRELAQKTFGDEIEITAQNIRLAVKVGLNINWAVQQLKVFALIRAEYNAKVAPIRAEYNAKVDPIWAEYYAKVDPIWAEYHAKISSIRAEYDAKTDSIWAEYKAKVDSIWAEYNAKVDPIWAEYYTKCGELLIDILKLVE